MENNTRISGWVVAVLLGLVIIGGVLWYLFREMPAEPARPDYGSLTPGKENLIRVTTPVPNQIVKSPIQIEGEARGTWFFEASFPIRLLDANGKELGVAVAQAQDEWMTENFVPFKAELRFSNPTTVAGTLVLEKDNPSGLPEHDDELRLPIRFEAAERMVKLFYYNADKDSDTSGNILCSQKGLEMVERTIPVTITPIQDAVRLLLQGELTTAERARGITTEYPLAGFTLVGADLKNGILTLEFTDPQNKTGGGACRVNILWQQIAATAKQFSEVREVQFKPAELFQP